MKVLYVCAELYPYLKTGGLADVGAALVPALEAEGCEVRMLLPGFAPFTRAAQWLADPPPGTGDDGGPRLAHQLRLARLPEGGIQAYLLAAGALYDERPGSPYTQADGQPWPDNAERFALLGWAAARLALGADPDWRPDVVHVHDWHAALAPLYLRLAAPRGPRPPSVITVHNLAYQGLFDAAVMPRVGLGPQWFGIDGVEFHGQLSFMKAGLQFAEAIATVSPRYAREITTPEQGCGLDGLLRARRSSLHGILNGVDEAVWNPETDALLPARYGASDLAGKAQCKRFLQENLGLEPRADAPLFGAVTRITEQKGLNLIAQGLDALVARGGQLAVLGSGDADLVQALRAAMARHPRQAVLHEGYDEALSHRIIAGSDLLLVPSRFEPCGLTQLYAMRYGTLPLVHAVGGLADTVTDVTLENLADGSATGIAFDGFGADPFDRALRRAFALWQRPDDWRAAQAHAMARHFSWRAAARRYHDLYREIAAP